MSLGRLIAAPSFLKSDVMYTNEPDFKHTWHGQTTSILLIQVGAVLKFVIIKNVVVWQY